MAKLFFQTEGIRADGDNYESASCVEYTDQEMEKLCTDLLREFLDAFKRDPKSARLSFNACSTHG